MQFGLDLTLSGSSWLVQASLKWFSSGSKACRQEGFYFAWLHRSTAAQRQYGVRLFGLTQLFEWIH